MGWGANTLKVGKWVMMLIRLKTPDLERLELNYTFYKSSDYLCLNFCKCTSIALRFVKLE